MTGDLYLLNAVWLGLLLFLIAAILPYTRKIVVMMLPFGLVIGWQYVRELIHTTNDRLGEGDQVVEIPPPANNNNKR